jgi:hypothetical protein
MRLVNVRLRGLFELLPARQKDCPASPHPGKIPGGYVVRDANGQALAYIYSRKNEAEARQAKVLTMGSCSGGTRL